MIHTYYTVIFTVSSYLVDRLGIEPSSHALQACADVTRLAHDPFNLVCRAGFEPANSLRAPCFQSRRSDQTELPTDVFGVSDGSRSRIIRVTVGVPNQLEDRHHKTNLNKCSRIRTYPCVPIH